MAENLGGRPTKYDPDFHPVDMQKWMAKGYSVHKVCAEWDVCRDTFYKWCNAHPDFYDAYKRAKMKQKAFYEDIGFANINNKDFNTFLYSMLSRATGALNTEERSLEINFAKCKSRKEKIAEIESAISDGSITPGEAERLINYVEKASNLLDIDALNERLQNIEERISELG